MSNFKVGDKIRHIKTGRVYTVIETPLYFKVLEYNGLPFYVYSDGHTDFYRTRQELEEDSRFELIEAK